MEEAPGNAGDLTLMHMLGNMQNIQNMHPWHGGVHWQWPQLIGQHDDVVYTYNTKSIAKQIQLKTE